MNDISGHSILRVSSLVSSLTPAASGAVCPKASLRLPRRFRSSVARAPCGSGRLATETRHLLCSRARPVPDDSRVIEAAEPVQRQPPRSMSRSLDFLGRNFVTSALLQVPGSRCPGPMTRSFTWSTDRTPSLGRSPAGRSEGGNPAAEQAELVAFGVGQHMPALVAGLADVGGAGASGQQAGQLCVLIAVDRADVQVQAQQA